MNAPNSWHSDDYEVTECECGHLTVRIGHVRVDLSREQFALLRQAVVDAAERFNVPVTMPLLSRRGVAH